MRSSSVADAVDVERLVQRVVDGLAHEHVVGDLDRAGDVLLARRRLREHRGHEVVGLHALDRRRVAPAVAEAQHHQRAVEVPAPAGLEHRGVEDGVLAACRRPSRLLTGSAGTSSSGKLWCGPSDSTMASSVAAACSSKLNVRQNFLRSARPSARLIRPPYGRVDAPAACRRCRRRSARARGAPGVGIDAEHRAADREVVDDHRGRRRASMPARLDQPVRARRRGRPRRGSSSTAARSSDTSADSSAVRAGASPIQNGTVGGASPASRTRTTPGLDLADLPRVGAEQEDVARHRLDRPVLVDGADERVVGLGDARGSRRSRGSHRPR